MKSTDYAAQMPPRVAFNPSRHRHFIREWRKHRGLTLERLAERIGTTAGNLSRIEKGQQPYTQDFLEAAAEALATDAASLIMRDPMRQDAIWSLWDSAKPAEREQIVNVISAMLRKAS